MNPDGSTDAVTHIFRSERSSRSFCGAVSYHRLGGWAITIAGAANPAVWQSIGTVPRNALCGVCCLRANARRTSRPALDADRKEDGDGDV